MTDLVDPQMYFIVRTDVSETSGHQRVFGAHDSEADAVSAGAMIAAMHPGQFAIYGGAQVVRLDRAEAPVTAVPVQPTQP
ncbi:hypothetical protein AFEL58S_02038 [Afipia felis]